MCEGVRKVVGGEEKMWEDNREMFRPARIGGARYVTKAAPYMQPAAVAAAVAGGGSLCTADPVPEHPPPTTGEKVCKQAP